MYFVSPLVLVYCLKWVRYYIYFRHIRKLFGIGYNRIRFSGYVLAVHVSAVNKSVFGNGFMYCTETLHNSLPVLPEQ